MRNVSRKIPARSLVFLLLLALVVGLAGSAGAQYERFKTRSVRVPERSDAGNWEGTYWYVSRDLRVALWIRNVEGLPEVRLKLASLISPDEFTTDWNGAATYEAGKGRGEFALSLTERDANTILGNWIWDFQVGNSVRRQLGEVEIYRSGVGHSLVMLFDPYKFYIGEAGKERWQPAKQTWTFRKASVRLVRWEELPF